jgi:bifunctional DNA-binding transcriptional regulator/antitoxin component of YhaV-PrlF toxin-antitoxin module
LGEGRALAKNSAQLGNFLVGCWRKLAWIPTPERPFRAAHVLLPVLDCRIAAMQHSRMSQVLPVSKRGTITLPPAYRRKLGLDRMKNPLVLAEEKNGKLVLEVATAVPVRDIPGSTIRGWIDEDDKAGAVLRKKGLLRR